MLIETIASNSLGKAIMVCLGSDLRIMAPSEISTLSCNPHIGCVKADLQRKMFCFLSLCSSFFFFKVLVEFYEIPLLLVPCSLLLSGSPKG